MADERAAVAHMRTAPPPIPPPVPVDTLDQLGQLRVSAHAAYRALHALGLSDATIGSVIREVVDAAVGG